MRSRRTLSLLVLLASGCGLVLDLAPSRRARDGGGAADADAHADGEPGRSDGGSATPRLDTPVTFGGPAGGYAAGYAVGVDDAGYVYLTGEAGEGAAVGSTPIGGEGTLLVMRLDPSGEVLWARRYGEGWGTAIAARDGRVCIAANITGPVAFGTMIVERIAGQDGLVACMAVEDGAVAGAAKLGAAGTDSALAVAIDADGRVYGAGQRAAPVELSDGTDSGSPVAWMSSWTAELVPRWTHEIGSTNLMRARAVALGDDELLVSGDLAGEAPAFGHRSRGGVDAWAASLQPSDGGVSWSVLLGSSQIDRGTSVLVQDGRVYVAGVYEGDNLQVSTGALDPPPAVGEGDAFVAAFEESRDASWLWGRGSSTLDWVEELVPARRGLVLVGSYGGAMELASTTLVPSGEADGMVIGLTREGEAAWGVTVGSVGEDRLHGAAPAPGGDVIWLTGTFEERITIGGEEIAAVGDSDGVLFRIRVP